VTDLNTSTLWPKWAREKPQQVKTGEICLVLLTRYIIRGSIGYPARAEPVRASQILRRPRHAAELVRFCLRRRWNERSSGVVARQAVDRRPAVR
jgi:hypothetical protein